uniref:Major facilitator superfamily (MFS) profile domain-containing protein n=1 Tax=Plectus sambesii TaxID=2011161 RepID=A0A914WJJ2_9BILA
MEPPIDRGWAWLILGGAFLNQLVILAIGKSLGLVYVALIDRFDATASAASVMQALLGGIGLFVGPLVTAMADAFTCRIVVMSGALLLSAAALIASQSATLNGIVYPFGILGGIGVGMVVCPAPIIVARYFDKRRALANGLLYSAAGVASTLGPLIMSFLLQRYSINGVFMIVAGWVLHVLIGGALYRPLTSWASRRERKPLRSAEAFEQKRLSTIEEVSLEMSSSLVGSPGESAPALQQFETAREYPVDPEAEKSPPFLTARSQPMLSWRRDGSLDDDSADNECYVSALNLAAVSLQNIPAERNVEKLRKRKWNFRRIIHRLCHIRAKEGHYVPLLDVMILSHPPVALHALGSMMGTSSFFLITVTPAHCKEGLGFSPVQVGWLLTVLGASETAGRLFIAAAGDRAFFRPRRPMIASLFMFIGASSTFASPLATSVQWQAVYLLIAPFVTGAFMAVHVLLLVDLIGTKRLGSAFGLVLCLEGVAACGTPLAIGILRDMTGNYIASYYLIGVCFTVSAVAIGLIPLASRHYPVRFNEDAS